VASTYGGRTGRKYHHAIVTNLIGVRRLMDYGVIGDTLDVRHPFLYRPLVEFALRLPPELCVRPYARKWVLREAMRGLLPEAVRTRIGKGTTLGLVGWSLAAQQTLLEPLVHNPILADLGLVDAPKLRAAFDAAPHQPQRRDALHGTVQATLVIEAWLQLRSGRWPRGSHRSSGSSRDVSRTHVHHPSA
jgi:asparagine synthase (glutamine-hydrolysing)